MVQDSILPALDMIWSIQNMARYTQYPKDSIRTNYIKIQRKKTKHFVKRHFNHSHLKNDEE